MKPSTFYHHSMTLFLAVVGLLLNPAFVSAAETVLLPAMKDADVKITTIEPERDVGYTVGDILQRTIVLDVKKPYSLQETSLPIVGYEHRWKGQPTGIELHKIESEKNDLGDSTQYVLRLDYQVFTNNVVAKPALLPAEVIKFKGNDKLYQYRIPSWSFRISPIAVYGSVKIELDMSPFRGPLSLDPTPEKKRLKVLIGVFAVALLGLLYILGSRAWLPRMGGPFARACRDINKLRKLPAADVALQQAVARVHQSLNATAGSSVFGDTLDSFLQKKPTFAPVKTDIEQFFGLSRQVFFEPQAAHQVGDSPLNWLRDFCRRCRDCERGLIPDKRI
jgi:mxaA protein